MGPSTVVQEYCLKWNNHHSTLVSELDVLLKQESLVDVTLAAEGKSVKVHRLVLCAFSTYFKELLCNQWDKQTVVFLKGVKFNQLKALVDFMYRGEVNVSRDQLAPLLSTAEALKIRGLVDGDEESSKKQNKRPAQQDLSTSVPVASSPASASSRPVKRARKPSEDSETPQATTPLPSLIRIPPPGAAEVSEAPSNCIDSPYDQPDYNDANAEAEAGRSESRDVPLGGLEPNIKIEEPDETISSRDEENRSENEHSLSQGDHHWGEGVNASVGSDFYGTNQSATENEDSITGIGVLSADPEDEENSPDEDAEIPKPKGRRKQPPRKAGAPERFQASLGGGDPRLVAAGKKAQRVLAEKYGEQAKKEGIAKEGKNPGAQLIGHWGARRLKAPVTGEPERGD